MVIIMIGGRNVVTWKGIVRTAPQAFHTYLLSYWRYISAYVWHNAFISKLRSHTTHHLQFSVTVCIWRVSPFCQKSTSEIMDINGSNASYLLSKTSAHHLWLFVHSIQVSLYSHCTLYISRISLCERHDKIRKKTAVLRMRWITSIPYI